MGDDSTELHSQARLRACYGLLVPLPAGTPLSLRAFLEDVLGLERRYAEERIQTILLNGLAVDGLDTLLPAGARLALSAAMPGVVGATLRKGGRYAPMRQGITHQDGAGGGKDGDADPVRWLELRCFNDIARELGAALLRRGVALPDDGLTPALTARARGNTAPLPEGLPPLPPNHVWIKESV